MHICMFYTGERPKLFAHAHISIFYVIKSALYSCCVGKLNYLLHVSRSRVIDYKAP